VFRICAYVAITRAANEHPRVVVAVLAGLVMVLISLAVAGAVSLIIYSAAWKWFLFAAISLAAFVRLSGRAAN